MERLGYVAFDDVYEIDDFTQLRLMTSLVRTNSFTVPLNDTHALQVANSLVSRRVLARRSAVTSSKLQLFAFGVLRYRAFSTEPSKP